MKGKPTNKCEHCTNGEESIPHLNWTFPMTYQLWERLKGILQKHTGADIQLKPESCLLGLGRNQDVSREKNILISILCLLTKHYIHVSKCNNLPPSIEGLKGHIRKKYRIENSLAHYTNIPNRINTKWGELVIWLEKGQP